MGSSDPELNRWWADILAGRFTSLRALLKRLRWLERSLEYPPLEREP